MVGILDAGISEGQRFVVMEFVDGDTLQPHCDPAHLLPVPQAIEVLYKCCGALNHAAQLGVVHRDIKPANIMITASRDIKVSDFGAAMMTRADTVELSEADRFLAVSRLDFFRNFSEIELWEVVKLAEWRKYSPGENLITEGELDQKFFIIATGLVKVTTQGQMLNAVRAGEPVGEMTCARRDHEPRSATVTAVEDTWAVGMKVDDLDRLAPACHARFSNAFLAIMAQRIAMLSGRLLHALQAEKIGMV